MTIPKSELSIWMVVVLTVTPITYGLLIVTDMKDLSASKRRLFRKKRLKLMNRTKLERMKNGVYFVSFEDPKPSINEIRDIKGLIQKFHVKAYFFLASQVEIEEWIEGDIYNEHGELDSSRLKGYFVFNPIKIEEK